LGKTNSEALNLVVVTDEFDVDTFAENIDTEQYVEEDDETAINESTGRHSLHRQWGKYALLNSYSVWCDSSSYYSDEKLRALKLKLINLQDYPN
jgi:hypothetical protein